jgi:hypothetical protein
MTPAPKRRFRWSLRTMFVVVTLFAGLTAWTLHNLHQVRERESLSRAFFAQGAAIGPTFQPGEPIIYKETGRAIPWMWWLLGAEDPGGDIWLSPEMFSEDEKRHLQSLFPEVYVVWVDMKNGRLLEEEEPTGIFAARWRCPTCGFIWDDGAQFASRSEAIKATARAMDNHNSSLHLTPPKSPVASQ